MLQISPHRHPIIATSRALVCAPLHAAAGGYRGAIERHRSGLQILVLTVVPGAAVDHTDSLGIAPRQKLSHTLTLLVGAPKT
jgi:hypothetical protein